MINSLAVFCLLFSFPADSFARAEKPGPVRDSAAFQAFTKRKYSELSKLFFLIDRYKDLDFKVVYEGGEYDPGFVTTFCRAILQAYYRKESALYWVKRYSYKSVLKEELILFRYPNGKSEVARDLLLKDLKDLEEAYQEWKKTSKT